MANRKALIFTGILVVGAAVVLLQDRFTSKAPDPRLGKDLISGVDVSAIDRIELGKGADSKSLTLVRNAAKEWTVGESNFSADASKVMALLDQVARLRYENLSGTRERAEEFGLKDGARIKFSASGKDLLSLDLGTTRRGGGEFVAHAGEDKVYLVNNDLRVQVDEEQWEQKTLLSLSKEDIKSLVFEPRNSNPKTVATLSREKGEDPLKVEGLADQNQAAPLVKTAHQDYANVSFDKRLDPSHAEADAALKAPMFVTMTLFDGRVYKFSFGTVGDKQKKHFMRIQGTAPEGATPEIKAKVDALNQLMSKYAFQVSPWIGLRFDKSMSDFVPSASKGKS